MGFGSSDGWARLEEIMEVKVSEECSRELEIFRLEGLNHSRNIDNIRISTTFDSSAAKEFPLEFLQRDDVSL